MSDPGKIKRKSLVVDKTFQFKYIRMVLIFVVFMTAVGALASYLVIWFTMWQLGLAQDEIISLVSQAIAFMSLFQLVIAIPFVLICGVVLTHRIVGPFGRIERFLDRLGEGELGAQLSVRKNDELRVLVEWMNEMSKKLAQLKNEGKL